MDVNSFGKILGLLVLQIALSSCSIDVAISHRENETAAPSTGTPEASDNNPNISYGEIVTTSNGTPGYQVQIVFGEIAEKQTTSSGWQVEGIINE